MKTPFRFPGTLTLTLFVFSSPILSMAQPTAPPQRPTGPGGTNLPRSVQPTGLSANGGSIANGVYANSIYRFSMQIPPGWAVVPAPAASAPVATGSASGQPVVPQLNRTLLLMTENAPLKKRTQRKSLQIIATHLATPPGPTAAESYLTYAQRKAKEQGLPVEYIGNPEAITIHGHKFSKATLTQTTDGDLLHVEQYVTTQGEALMQFLFISPDEAGLKAMQPEIQSLQFQNVEVPKSRKRATAK